VRGELRVDAVVDPGAVRAEVDDPLLGQVLGAVPAEARELVDEPLLGEVAVAVVEPPEDDVTGADPGS
jgi:hypothetical protein